jgi:hypothetical protein
MISFGLRVLASVDGACVQLSGVSHQVLQLYIYQGSVGVLVRRDPFCHLTRNCWKLRHTQYCNHGFEQQSESIVLFCLSSSLPGIPFSWGIRLALSLRP